MYWNHKSFLNSPTDDSSVKGSSTLHADLFEVLKELSVFHLVIYCYAVWDNARKDRLTIRA